MGFDPVTIGTMMVVGGAIKAYGSYETGEATARADEYQAQVARNNALIAKQNATWAMEAGEQAVEKEALKTRAQAGAIKVAQAAGGIDVNTGSAAKVQGAQAALGELDALTIRSDTARKVYGYEVEEESQVAKAQLAQAEGKQARIAGDIGAAESLLGGATSAGAYQGKVKLG